jgi:hypothetical protein
LVGSHACSALSIWVNCGPLAAIGCGFLA